MVKAAILEDVRKLKIVDYPEPKVEDNGAQKPKEKKKRNASSGKPKSARFTGATSSIVTASGIRRTGLSVNGRNEL